MYIIIIINLFSPDAQAINVLYKYTKATAQIK